jgi:hypothetical protein
MKDEARPSLLHYCLCLLWQRRSSLLLCALLPILAWTLPLLTPWPTQSALLQPTRVQTAWALLWLSLGLFFVFQAATLGRELCACGLLEHVNAAHQRWRRALLPVVLAVGLWLNLALLGVLLLSGWLHPSSPIEASLWNALLVQQTLLFELSAVGLLALAAALGTRFSQAPACLICLGLLAAGWWFAAWIDAWMMQTAPRLHPTLGLLLPRYDLADLTTRMVFKLGPLPMQTALRVAAVIGLQTLGLAALARWITRCHGR